MVQEVRIYGALRPIGHSLSRDARLVDQFASGGLRSDQAAGVDLREPGFARRSSLIIASGRLLALVLAAAMLGLAPAMHAGAAYPLTVLHRHQTIALRITTSAPPSIPDDDHDPEPPPLEPPVHSFLRTESPNFGVRDHVGAAMIIAQA